MEKKKAVKLLTFVFVGSIALLILFVILSFLGAFLLHVVGPWLSERISYKTLKAITMLLGVLFVAFSLIIGISDLSDDMNGAGGGMGRMMGIAMLVNEVGSKVWSFMIIVTGLLFFSFLFILIAPNGPYK